ncbi:hypothetical protein MBLNU459_g0936t1 [Dothideomycetes sp. NU459]
MKARDAAPGTYMVVYTPHSFKKHPRSDSYFDDMEELRDRRPKTYRSNSGVSISSVSTVSNYASPEAPSSPLKHLISGSESDTSPDSVYPCDEEDSVLREITHCLEITKTLASSPDPGSPTPPFANDAALVVHYKNTIIKTLVPSLTESASDQPDDPILIEAKTFPPLRHALCAITSLSLAVNGQRAFEDALHHYRRALESSVGLAVDPLSDQILYMHYVLMIYDTCYEIRTPNEEHTDVNKSIWSRHFGIIFNLVMKRHEAGIETPPWMLRQLLELDIQACLAGNAFGQFVRAFLDRDLCVIFGGVFSIETHMQPEYSTSNEQALRSVLQLWHGTTYRMARIARLTIRLRSRNPAIDQSAEALVQKQRSTVDRYYSELCAFWTREYPSFLPFASTELPLGARRVFDSALLNYSMSSIYLQTSMFSGQKQQNSASGSSSVPVSCKNLVFPTFLAGYANTDWNAKSQALGMIEKLEPFSVAGNASRARQLLSDVHKVQRCATDVDWIELGKQQGLSIINFDL